MTEALVAEAHYREHQRKVQRAHPNIVTKEALSQSDKLLKTFHNSSANRKNFDHFEMKNKHDRENARLVGSFIDIFHKGRDLSVGRADYRKNLGALQASPVLEQHSLNYTGRK